MAGAKDTPEDRRLRDEAAEIPKPPDDPDRRDILTASAAEIRRPRGPGRVTVGAGARIRLDDRKAVQAMRARHQAWQSEAWAYFKEIPEFAYTVLFTASLMSKLRLFPAVRLDPKDAPIGVDDENSGVDADTAKLAQRTLERLRSPQGGQRALIRAFSVNMDVCGEAYLHGHEDPDGEEEWNIRSVHELVVEGERYVRRLGPGGKSSEPVSADDFMIRLWEPDPEFSALSFSLTRPMLAEMESLLLLGREVRATAKSRVLRGFVLYPQELSFGSADPTRDGGDGEARDDPFVEDFQAAMETAIQDEGSAAATVPIGLSGPAEFLKEFRFVSVSAPLDASLDQRIEARILRIARGMNMPVEVTTGLAATTFANAAQIERQQFDAHIEPRAVLLCDALTSGYYQEALVAAGVDPKRAKDFFIWFDPTDLLIVPDQAEQARAAYGDDLISGDAARQYLGYSEADAPTKEELLLRVLLEAAKRMDPFIQGQLLVDLGLVKSLQLPQPTSGTTTDDTSGTQTVTPASSGAAPDEMVAAATPHDKGARLGRRLMEIDRELRLRLRVAAEHAMRRALERAGAKVKGSLSKQKGEVASAARDCLEGVPTRLVAATLGRPIIESLCAASGDLLEGAFDEMASDAGAWIDVAAAQSLGEVEKFLGHPLDAPARAEFMQRSAANNERAVEWLREQLATLAGQRLYDPTPGAVTVGESDATFTVPEGLVRQVLAIAGGDSPVVTPSGGLFSEDGTPVGGIGTGPDVMGVISGNGAAVEGYVWDYGSAPRTPFPPHEALDGVFFENFDDPVLTNDDGWPSDLCVPGDHDGCACDFYAAISGSEGVSQDTGDGG